MDNGYDGYIKPGYEGVRQALERNIAVYGDTGAAFAVYVDGELAVDIWGGLADSARGRRWEVDTLQAIFSGTKGLIAVCLLALTERGQLALDAPVARYWPEFAAAGKDGVLVRHVVSHTAGLPGIRQRAVGQAELLGDQHMAALLADEEPVWQPGTVLTYHPLSFGWLCSELIRRVDGRSAGAFFADEIAAPLGLRLWIGLPDAEQSRVARLEFSSGYGTSPQTNGQLVCADPVRRAAWGNPPIITRDGLDWNDPDVRRSELPGAGAIGEARSVARLYGCLANGGEIGGVRLLTRSTIEQGMYPLSRGQDACGDGPLAYGTGFRLQTDDLPLGPPADAFGHGGAGGSLHGAWPSHRVGFSYATNQRRDDRDDPRAASLLNALHTAVA